MTKKRNTKRALLASIMSMILCVTMLLGTTLAWFTDTATNKGNRIKAGEFKIDLLMDKTETGNYVSIKNGEGDIFSEAAGNGMRWEPGKTEIVYLQVENKGDLALKYNIELVIEDNGLAGALEYAILNGAKAADIKGKADKWSDIEAYPGVQISDVPSKNVVAAPNGKLLGYASDYFALAVHMKEEAGIEYAGKDIAIDVTVSATQVPEEEDSFGNQYDASAGNESEPPTDSNEPAVLFSDDFETPAETTGNWTKTHNHILTEWVHDNPEFAYDGTHVLLMQDNSTSLGHTATSKDIAVTPGKTYTLTYQVREHEAAYGKSAGCEVKLVFVDAEGNELTDATVTKPACYDEGQTSLEDWVEKTVTGEAPANAVNLRVLFTTAVETKDIVYAVDAVKVIEVKPAAHLFSDDFETPAETTGNWTKTHNHILTEWEHDNPDFAYSGTHVLLMQDYSTSLAHTATSKDIAVVPGSTYTLTYQVREHESAYGKSAGCEVKLVFVDAGGNELTDATVTKPACYDEGQTSVETWVEKTVTGQAPANAANLRILFTTAVETKDIVYCIDDVKVSGDAGALPEPEPPVSVFSDDFETAVTDTGNWTKTHNHILTEWLADSGFAYDGTHVLLIQDNSTSLGHTATSKDIAVTPGKIYTLTYQAREHSSAYGKSAGCEVKLVFVDAGGNELTDATITKSACYSQGQTSLENWEEKTVIGQAPANAANLRILFTTDVETKGIAYAIDALNVTEATGTLPESGESTDPVGPPEVIRPDIDYPEVTSAMIAQDISEMQAGGHPYLFFRESDLNTIKTNVTGGNEFVTDQYAGVKASATSFLDTEPELRTDPEGIGLNRGFTAWEIVSKCAFVYLMEGDERYAQRAYDEVEYFATLESFGSKQFIDIAQIVFAGSLCYDWLYDWLTPDQRATIKDGYMEKHFEIISRFFKNPDAEEFTSTTRFSGYYDGNNHCAINNTMNIVGALAFADDDNITFYADLIARSLDLVETCFDNLYPDSAWYEGPSYWSFVGPFMARMFACMESGLGTWYGYEEYDHILNTSDYQIYAQSNQGYFMVNDCTFGSAQDPEKYYFAKMKDDDGLKRLTLDLGEDTDSVFLCIWYDTELDHDSVSPSSVSVDKYFRNTDQVIFRDTWEGNQELYTGMLVMPAYLTHGHMNSGTIALDALGERWITNAGGEPSYPTGYFNNGINDERWKWHGTRAEANSCLVINPSSYGGQYIYSQDVINEYVSGVNGAYAWSDLTETYKDQVTDYKRGLMLTNNRRTVVLQDEVKLTESSEVYSFINFYKSEIEISQDQKTVIVSKGNKKIYINIICDQPYEVSTMRYTGLPTSQLNVSARNKDINKLVIRVPEASELNLRVEMTPYLFDEDIANVRNSGFVPMEDWEIDENTPKTPMLTDLKFDGVTAEGFNAHNRCYELPHDVELPQQVEAIADTTLYDVSVSEIQDIGYKILVTDKSDSTNTNTYIVYNGEPPKTSSYIDVSSYTKLNIVGVTASAEPQEANKAVNVLDGDFETRWSASSAKSETGEQYITLELKEPAVVDVVAVAFYRDGVERIAYFDIQVSEDGNNWVTAGEYDSSGITDDFEYYDIGGKNASYVRIVGYGTNVSAWNSITEVAVYSK